MMKTLRILAVGLLISAVPATASAQWQETMQYMGPTDRYRGQNVAPYELQMPAFDGPVFDVFCIDPRVDPHGEPYLGWVSPVTLGTLGQTKLYDATADASIAYERYWKTAWLATQYELYAEVDAWTIKQRASLQGALWEFGGMLEDGGSVWLDDGATGAPEYIDDWVTAANDAYATDQKQIDGASWLVLTTADTRLDQQEFLVRQQVFQQALLSPQLAVVATPEPATWLLLVTGLIIVLGVRIRRARTA